MYPNETAAVTAAQAGLAGSSEDCLFLNVFAPAGRGEGLLPVMVWIHGGGYTLGASNTFDRESLHNSARSCCSQGPDVALSASYLYSRPQSDYVTVTINYRLGMFGFLAGQEVKDGGALNAGIRECE